VVVAELSWVVVMGCSQLYKHVTGDGVLAVTKGWLGPRVGCDQVQVWTKGWLGPRVDCDQELVVTFSCEDAFIKSITFCMIRWRSAS
jgi:hypothetical protein